MYAVLRASEKGRRMGRRKSAKARRKQTRGTRLRGKNVDVRAHEKRRTVGRSSAHHPARRWGPPTPPILRLQVEPARTPLNNTAVSIHIGILIL